MFRDNRNVMGYRQFHCPVLKVFAAFYSSMFNMDLRKIRNNPLLRGSHYTVTIVSFDMNRVITITELCTVNGHPFPNIWALNSPIGGQKLTGHGHTIQIGIRFSFVKLFHFVEHLFFEHLFTFATFLPISLCFISLSIKF